MATKISSRFASLFLIVTVLLSIILTGCASQAVPQETTTPLPTETSAPTATAKPTLTQAPTKTPVPTETLEPTATEAPGVKSEVYTFDEFRDREISFEELQIIPFDELDADDLSVSIEINGDIMPNAIAMTDFVHHSKQGRSFMDLQRNDPNFANYTANEESQTV